LTAAVIHEAGDDVSSALGSAAGGYAAGAACLGSGALAPASPVCVLVGSWGGSVAGRRLFPYIEPALLRDGCVPLDLVCQGGRIVTGFDPVHRKGG
jgi:hypothetical protein